MAFSDANALWEPGALRELVGAFADPHVGYACGRCVFVQEPAPAFKATNQEGMYWRYEMALRARESRLSLDHRRQRRDLRHTPRLLHRGRPNHGPRPLVPLQHGQARLARRRRTKRPRHREDGPSIEGEWKRKRRMMSHTWPIVLRGGMLSPRGYSPSYASMIFSHRLLRYLTPFLHTLALVANIALVAAGAGSLYLVDLGLAARPTPGRCARADRCRTRLFLIARYYVLTTASPAAGLWDWLRHGTAASWEAAEGTR